MRLAVRGARMIGWALAALLLAAPAAAQRVEGDRAEAQGLYEAEVPVRTQAEAERTAGYARALAQVFAKLSGDRGIASRPGVAQELRRAADYVDGFDYRQDESIGSSGAPSFRTMLVVRFVPEAIDALTASQADQKFLNDVTEALIETTKFDLPAAFLKKWIRTAGENPLNEEEAEDEYNKSEKGLRYQLIEARVMRDHEVKVNFEDLKAYTSAMIRKQMAQFGQMDPSQEDVDGIVARVMSNQDEVRRLTEQVVSEKMLNLFKEKVSATEKTVSYEQFVKEMYGE